MGVGGGVEVGEIFRGSDSGRFCRPSPLLLRSTATRQGRNLRSSTYLSELYRSLPFSCHTETQRLLWITETGIKSCFILDFPVELRVHLGTLQIHPQDHDFALGSFYIFRFPGGESSATSPTMENSTKPQILVILWDTSVYGRLSHII